MEKHIKSGCFSVSCNFLLTEVFAVNIFSSFVTAQGFSFQMELFCHKLSQSTEVSLRSRSVPPVDQLR